MQSRQATNEIIKAKDKPDPLMMSHLLGISSQDLFIKQNKQKIYLSKATEIQTGEATGIISTKLRLNLTSTSTSASISTSTQPQP